MPKKAKVTVHPAYEIGEISPRIYSAFLEPIGNMVNGSMFNPKHPTADEKGLRHDFIDAIKATDLPAVRLPAGIGKIPSVPRKTERLIWIWHGTSTIPMKLAMMNIYSGPSLRKPSPCTPSI